MCVVSLLLCNIDNIATQPSVNNLRLTIGLRIVGDGQLYSHSLKPE